MDFYVRKGYYGGATDHYKMYGKNLYYYDINSLYPKAMLNPMPFNPVKYHADLNNTDINSFWGFALAEIEYPKNIKIINPLDDLTLFNKTISKIKVIFKRIINTI